MFISIVLNTEYMDYASRKTWYLKNLLHCKDNGWVLITHDYIRKHFDEIQNNILERIFDQMEMRRFTWDEVNDVEQYFIPDEVFDNLEEKLGSHTEMLLELNKSVNFPLENCLREIISQIKKKHPDERIDGIFHCLESFETLRYLSNEYGIPLIHYSFSAIRRTMGYRQTLYQVNTQKRFWDSSECKERFDKFCFESQERIPVFSNEEIITLIGKEHTLPLIQLIDSKPKYEIGICCECFSVMTQTFCEYPYTDDDIFYECNRLFSKDSIKVRSHAIHLNTIQIDRSEVHNDPASTILSCKRLTAVQSQILLKAFLWKRTAVIKKPFMAFTFLGGDDFMSLKIADIRALNFYIFCYLIPSELMFSKDYWNWRMTNPSEIEIYWKHLDFLFSKLDIDKTKVLNLNGKERFKYLLESRGCDKQLVANLLSDETINNINWDVTSSQFDVVSENGSKSYWRIDTENEDGSLNSELFVDVTGAKEVKFYPLYDVAGFARLNSVKINGKEYITNDSEKQYKFMPKNKGCFTFSLDEVFTGKLQVECGWEYKKVFEHLNSQFS